MFTQGKSEDRLGVIQLIASEILVPLQILGSLSTKGFRVRAMKNGVVWERRFRGSEFLGKTGENTGWQIWWRDAFIPSVFSVEDTPPFPELHPGEQ